jgi:hypothetical protein
MPSCLRTATLLRALEKVSLITLSFFFFFFLSSFLGVLGDGACIETEHYMEFQND